MTRGLNSTLLLAATLGATVAVQSLRAGAPVVDPYYQARQSSIQQRSAARLADTAESDADAGETDEDQYDPGVTPAGLNYPSQDEADGFAAEEIGPALEGDEMPDEQSPDGCGNNGCGGNGCGGNGCDGDGGFPYGCDPCAATRCDGDPNADLICGYGNRFLYDRAAAMAAQQAQTGGALWQQVNSHTRLWANISYVSFWLKGNPLPPLVTTSPAGTSQTSAGVLGLNTTTVLFGNDRVNTDQRNGARIQAGLWLVDGEFVGIDGHYYDLATSTTNFNATSNFNINPNAQILARPFFNNAINMQDARIVAFPNFRDTAGDLFTLNGKIAAAVSSSFQSASLGGRHLLFIDFEKQHRLFLTGGYRFLNLNESLSIETTTNFEGQGVPPGTAEITLDKFATKNQFHGGYFGMLTDHYFGRFSIENQLQLAMGNVHEVQYLSGMNNLVGSNLPPTPYGLLTQPTNIGTHIRNQFALVPEINTTLGYLLLKNVRLTLGYNFTYVSRVLRPGGTIDPVLFQPVSPTPPTPSQAARPQVTFANTNLWIQGVTAGVDVRF